jgi:hypothetical protein
MAETKTGPKATPAGQRRATAETHERPSNGTVDRTADLSGEVFTEIEAGQRSAIKAVRTFVETVDRALPPHGEGPSRRQEVVDAAMEMADRLVHVQYEFLRQVVQSAGKSLGKAGGDT